MAGKKKKKKAAVASPAADAPVANSAPAAGPERACVGLGRRAAPAFLAVGAAAAVFLYWASTLPGSQRVNDDFIRCRERMGMIASAAAQWSASHGGGFPPSLSDLERAGLLQGAASLSCPLTGRPFVYEAGLGDGMPADSIVLHCPFPARHTFVLDEKGPMKVLFHLGADLGFHGPPFAGGWEEQEDEFREKLAVQEEVLAVAAGLRHGVPGAREKIENFLFDRSRPELGRRLAAWAMGESGRADFVPALERAFSRCGLEISALGLDISSALLKLGSERPVPYLIRAAGTDDERVRRQCGGMLEAAFASESPPPPRIRAYLSANAAGDEVAALREWWSKRSRK